MQAASEVSNFKVIIFKKSWVEEVSRLVRRLKVASLSFEGINVTYDTWANLKSSLKGIRLKTVKRPVEELREIKDSSEVILLKEAIRIADKGFNEARRLIGKWSSGVTELQVSSAIEGTLKKSGAFGPSFDIIVASGLRSALPHGKASDKKIKKGEFVIVDMGALYEGYHSDETRTFVTAKATRRQQKVYGTVKEAHDRAIDAVKPGVKTSEIDRIARGFIDKAGYGEYFGHGLGHGTGLNIHEGPGLSPKSPSVIEEGMVFTIEPGIYIEGFGGVRIEDMLIVTADGCEVLTKSSKELELLG